MPYVYAPIWAALFAPVATTVGPIAFFDGVLIVHAIALIGSIWLTARLFSLSVTTTAAVWLACGATLILVKPFYLALSLNQPHILVTFLILLGFERYLKGHSVTAGFILALATALKLSPLVFGLIFLMDRNWKAAGAMAAGGLGLLALSIALTGVDLHLAFLEQLGRVGDHVVITPINHSFDAVAIRISDILTGELLDMTGDDLHIASTQTIWRTISLVCLILAIGMIWVKWAKLPKDTRIPRAVLALWAASTLFAPLAWTHYFMGPVLLLVALMFAHRQRGHLLLGAAVLILLSNPVLWLALQNDMDPIWLMLTGTVSLVFIYVTALWSPPSKTP